MTTWRPDSAVKGPGEAYLIQHSAGSGARRTPSHGLPTASHGHHDNDTKVFGKVIVVTDRPAVLGRATAETVRQFESAPGTIVTVEGKTRVEIE